MPLLDNCIPTPGLAPSNVLNQLGGGGLTMPDLEWINLRRPFVNSNGKACVTINSLKPNDYVVEKGVKRRAMRTYLVNDLRNRGYNLPLVTNATALPMSAWIEMDRVMLREVRQRLVVTADLEARSSYGGFDAFNRSTVEYNAMSDFGEAIIDMDAATDGRVDGPLFLPRSTPLPITHSDFGFTSRQNGIARAGGMPFDTASIEQGTRRVAESIEDQVLGNITGMTFGTRTSYFPHDGTSTVYGYRNFDARLTKTNFTAPTTGGWVANTTYTEILTALQQLADQYYDGPFMLYYSTDWDPYMNQVFSISGGNNNNETLLTMLKKHPKILDVKYVPRLTATFTLLFVQMTSDVVRLINGMDFTTIQWEEKGGLELRIKVLAIKVPQLRSTYAGRVGLLHGTTT